MFNWRHGNSLNSVSDQENIDSFVQYYLQRSQNWDVDLQKTSSSSGSSVDKDFVIVSDDVLQKPAQLYECVFVISCDEFIVMPVSQVFYTVLCCISYQSVVS